MKIHSCLMTQNELNELVPNIEGILPYVDSVNIVDGGSNDGTILYMRNWSAREPKIRFFLHPWQDNFPAQRNNYLMRVAEIAQAGDWLIVFDPDEYIEEKALRALPLLAHTAESNGCNMVGLCSKTVRLMGPHRVYENDDSYWKRLFIKWTPDFFYGHSGEGPVHEGYGGIPHQMLNTGLSPLWPDRLYYEHRKQERGIHLKGCRNLFCGGGGANLGSLNPRWVELRRICSSLHIDDWHTFYRYMLAGNIDQKAKDWMIKCRNERDYDGASEHRECYLTYFRILHPEEEPIELKDEAIP